MEDVCFERMVPAMVVARRRARNLAYLPVGNLEWHGCHMPFGTDCFTVLYLAQEAARRFGGVVFPPVYYGDVRYQLHDCRVEWRRTYVKSMEIPEPYAAAFPLQNRDGSPGGECPTQPDDGLLPQEALEFSLQDQERCFARHIARILLRDPPLWFSEYPASAGARAKPGILSEGGGDLPQERAQALCLRPACPHQDLLLH